MSAVKTVVFWVFVVLALSLGVYSYFQLKKNKKPQLEAIHVLPDSCLLYLNTTDFSALNKKINSQSLIADKLKRFTEFEWLCKNLHHFDSLFNAEKELEKELKHTLIHFAIYDHARWLITFNIKELGQQKKVTERFAQVLKAKAGQNGLLAFENDKKEKCWLLIKDGVVLFSNSQEMPVAAMEKGAKFSNSVQYKTFLATLTESNLLSIYINESLYGEDAASKKLNLSGLCKKGYCAGAINIEPSELRINGYLQPDSSELLSAFEGLKAQETDQIFEQLPSNAVYFQAYGFENYEELMKKLPSTDDPKADPFWVGTNAAALYNVNTQFSENLGGHMITFETAAGGAHVTIPVKDTAKGKECLQFMSDSIIQQDSVFIYRLRPMKDPSLLFKPLLLTAVKYAAISRSHLYFSEKPSSLFAILNSLKRGWVLTKNESFNAYRNQHFPETFNYLVYASPSHHKHERGTIFNFKHKKDEDPFENFKHLSYSLINDKKIFKFRLHLLHETENRQKDLLWTLQLDTTCTVPAQAFSNHITNENELLIQDDANTLYLVNAKGSILWKKHLSEKILSDIYKVDIYKNNKFQILFNTPGALHLVDRNGNYVENFPVKLPYHSTAPLSVFDYDGTKEYRLLVPCKNKLIYNYSLSGKKLEGFNLVRTDNEVNLPIKYAAVGGTHYLVAVDTEGKIYTFSRKGIGRIGLRNRTVAHCSAFYLDVGGSVNTTHLVYLDDKNGLINKISFSDNKIIAKLSHETNNSVTFRLVDENRSTDLLVTSENRVLAYDFSGNMILEKEAEFDLSHADIYTDESQSVIYGYSKDENSIVIFDLLNQSERKISATAMPMISNLFRENKKYMLVTNGKELQCLLLD